MHTSIESRPLHHIIDPDLPARLLSEAQAGEAHRIAELIDVCERLARSKVAQILHRPRHDPAVDDVLQDVWERLMRAYQTIREPQSVVQWILVVSRHTALAASRRARKTSFFSRTEPEITALEETDTDAIRHADYDASHAAVHLALSRLRPNDRDLIEALCATDRPDYVAVSTHLGRPIGSLGPTRRRVLERLANDPDIRRLAMCA